jgi:methylenetetrahydrofolate--tRNA-(uracil-5-)-methyltransferase
LNAQKTYGETPNTGEHKVSPLQKDMKKYSNPQIIIIGAGLAGSEAAWQLAKLGLKVRIYEMRPHQKTPAHQTGKYAELVCSNSLRSKNLGNAVGLLKEEMRALGSLVIEAADLNAIPGGDALVVDREGFSNSITQSLQEHPLIEIVNEEIGNLFELRNKYSVLILVATGPLTSPALSENLRNLLGSDYLYFYDSIAPIVDSESIDRKIVFAASRYGKGGDDYLNCPLNREEYDAFIDAVLAADKVPTKDFESPKFFEGCLPVEVMAERGRSTLAFGPMKPIGLNDPRTGKRPYAVVQLRQDNRHQTLYNLVGFQTRMKYTDQKRVFRMIPGLENADFVRLGSMHRNTYIHSPTLLNMDLELKHHAGIFLAGQMIGVEGYVESAATGLYAGLILSKRIQGGSFQTFPPFTAMGALIRHVIEAETENFQPMNINFGLFDIPEGMNGKQNRLKLAEFALKEIKSYS